MSTADWIQSASLLFVAVASILGTLQLREVIKQSATLSHTLRQAAYESFQAGHAGYLGAWVANDHQALRWHLSTRGYPVSDIEGDKKTLYLLYKLETHERNVLNHNNGLVPSELWEAWLAILRTDISLPEFQALWPTAKKFFAGSLVTLVDQLLRESQPTAG